MTSKLILSVTLTAREKQLLGMLSRGLTTKMIAPQMFTSEKNVQRIILELRARYDCLNTTQLCVLLKEHYAETSNNTIAEGVGEG